MKYWPFKVIKDENNRPLFEVEYNGKIEKFYPEEISARIILKLKRITEDFCGHEINNAIITVTAYFNDLQRQSTKNAGTITGLDILTIFMNQLLLQLLYNLDITKNNKKEKNILVFNFGGGNLDITILSLFENIYEVKSTYGNSHFRRRRFR